MQGEDYYVGMVPMIESVNEKQTRLCKCLCIVFINVINMILILLVNIH